MSRLERYFLPGLFLLAAVAVIIALSLSAGRPKFTYDSAFYLSAAKNFTQGHGLVTDLTNMHNPLPYEPFNRWPPLFPVTISLFVVLGLSPVWAASVVSALAFGVTVWFVGLLGRRFAGPAAGLIAAGLALLSVSYWIMSASALSDMMFSAVVIGALYYMTVYLGSESRRRGAFLTSVSFAAAAAMTRHIGVSLAVFGAVCLTAEAIRRRSVRDLGLGAVYAAGTVAPLVVWTAFDPMTWGVGAIGVAPPTAGFWQNLEFYRLRMSVDWGLYATRWGLDLNTLASVLRACALIGAVAVVVVGVVRWWREGPTSFPALAVVPVILLVTYMLSIVVIRSLRYIAFLDTRLVSPPYVGLYAIVGAAAVLFWKGAQDRLEGRSRALALASVALAVAIIPLWGVVPSVVRNQRTGEGFAAPEWRDAPAMSVIREKNPNLVVTDVVAPVYLFTGVPAKGIPFRGKTPLLEQLHQNPALDDGRFLVYVSTPDVPAMRDRYEVATLLGSQFVTLVHTPHDLLVAPRSW